MSYVDTISMLNTYNIPIAPCAHLAAFGPKKASVIVLLGAFGIVLQLAEQPSGVARLRDRTTDRSRSFQGRNAFAACDMLKAIAASAASGNDPFYGPESPRRAQYRSVSKSRRSSGQEAELRDRVFRQRPP